MKSDISHGVCLLFIVLAQTNILYGLSVGTLENEIDMALAVLRNTEKRSDNVQIEYMTKRQDFYNENKVDSTDDGSLIKGVPNSIPCAKFSHPKHGQVQCGGRLCLVKCFPGYTHSDETAFVYACNLDTQKWETLPENKPIPWPNCISESFLEGFQK